jgi:uncharacterized protein
LQNNLNQKANGLINEESPYLLQHAYNPVDWQPWGEEAFSRAKEEDKPVFLSIGYSACHWCHVMAHESFEDKEIAHLINDTFIAIKVDREERPDIDHIYMAYCQLMNGYGGWPLNIIITPEKKPFFAATYIPKESRSGRSGLKELIPEIEQLWLKERKKIQSSADKITYTLQREGEDALEQEPGEQILEDACLELEENFDERYGGFGSAPKFPMPHQLIFLIRYWQKSNYRKALQIAEKTLLSLRAGGIYDHLGYGFHRYSTDKMWVLPHFEKMLYDQALLSLAYTEAYQATGKDLYKITVREIFSYLQREMLAPEGGFYSAEDADSEGIEGKYYLWSEREIKEILGETVSERFKKTYIFNNNLLYLNNPDDEKPILQAINRLENARKKLFNEREKRIHPDKDDKILTDWNGLIIAALARAAFVFAEDHYLKLAYRTADFIDNNMYYEGKLLHRYRNGNANIRANLDDFSFLIWGLIELYQASFKPQYLKKALELNQELLDHFRDKESAGFFFTDDLEEDLPVRKKELYDGALPSGNSVALSNVLKLAHLTGNYKLEEIARQLIRTFSGSISRHPSAYCHFLLGIKTFSGPFYDLVLVGREDDANLESMLNALKQHYQPELAIIFKPTDKENNITDIAKYTEQYREINGQTTAYICKDYTCSLPITEVEKMLEQLS